MTTGTIELEHWNQFEERTKEAWRGVVREHGFEPKNVAFPLVIEGDTMVVTEYLLNEQGMKYMDAKLGEPATRIVEVKLRTEVGLPRICRA